MKKGILVLLLSVFSLNSCFIRALLPHDKKYPPTGGKVWYSQNEKEDYPNIEIMFSNSEDNKEEHGYVSYRGEKKKASIVLQLAPYFRIYNFGDEPNLNSMMIIDYNYDYKNNLIKLKKASQNENYFGFNFNDYLPFNLYIKDFNEDEWYTKYPEDRIE